MSLTVEQILDRCEKIVNDTNSLNQLLHNPDFVDRKMALLKVAFPESSGGAQLALLLSQLSSILRGDEEIRSIIRDECGTLSGDTIYPHFLLYCSIVVYIEYIRR